jgi:pimeloyl-ACP methyl ester carboxylesterase
MNIEIAGERVYLCTAGRAVDPSRPAVVFLHGAGMDHTVWTLPARHFARHGRTVLALDLPGHGRSGGSCLQGIPAMADWVIAVLDALGIGQAALAGHSMGSLVALDAAARHPVRVRALAMVGTTVPMPVSDVILEESAANRRSAFEMLTAWGYSKAHQYGGNSNPGIWMTGATLRLFERARPGVLHADMSACNSYADGLQRAAQVQCPALLVLGAEDRLTPLRSTAALRQALGKASVRVIERAGHTLMVEAPNELLDALKTIL